ncbi:hypothetical protein [Anaerocolumna sp.]|uniref:hypothetical protein n=1 Tax=Anaerocolumna sp. TaxID=2041569 RepID=UPI0028AB7AEF|nr:hypothetical protein [Anaerocolumna sp.]
MSVSMSEINKDDVESDDMTTRTSLDREICLMGFPCYIRGKTRSKCTLRLQHALKEDLLCPFHYFGITDIEIDGEIMDDKTGMRNFSYLVSDKRLDKVSLDTVEWLPADITLVDKIKELI